MIFEGEIKGHEDAAFAVIAKVKELEEFAELARQGARTKRAEFKAWKERFNR
jgi:hypothetical protein